MKTRPTDLVAPWERERGVEEENEEGEEKKEKKGEDKRESQSRSHPSGLLPSATPTPE